MINSPCIGIQARGTRERHTIHFAEGRAGHVAASDGERAEATLAEDRLRALPRGRRRLWRRFRH